jgi:RNA-binding protein YlmH
MMNLDKEEQIFRKRLLDQANTADNRGICIFSDFLNLNEQNIFSSLKQELPKIKYFAYGGFQDAERKILCFCGNTSIDKEQDIEFPVSCIKIVPLNQKFSDSLNHRDFLGAVLNLGLDRGKIGDILINDNEGYIFVHTGISEFITDQLVKVKHTMVNARRIDRKDFDYRPKFREIAGTVSSVRLDSILSVAFNSSRSSLTGLIEGGKVYVGGRLILSNSYILKENDVVSVRGLGKFIFGGTSYQTKKGRYSVKILLYIT